jgi:high-affinity iron transporter
MIASLIIAFREILEASLIVGIVLGYLNKTGQQKYKRLVWLAVLSAVVCSIIGAILFNALAGGFVGRAEMIFEGVTTLIGAILLTTMIFWMMGQKKISQEIEANIAEEIEKPRKFGLFSLVFVSILRKGIETVIFLSSASFVSRDNNLSGAIIGILLALILGYVLYNGLMKVNLKKFFNITSILLILFAAGLIAHSFHEFQEAGIIPSIIEHVWDINPGVNPDGSYPPLHDKGWIGSILGGLLGYNGNPSLIEVIGYAGYLALIASYYQIKFKK